MSISWSDDQLAVGLEEAHLATVLHRAEADAIGFAGDRIPQRDIRNMDRHVLVDDAALLAFHRIRALMLLQLVDAGDDHVLVVDNPRHVTALALVASGDNHHVVAFSDLAHGSSY